MASIRLNFLSLKKNKFDIVLYRRPKIEGEERQEGFFFFQLYENAERQEKIKYAISFDVFDGGERWVLSSFDHIDITKHYLLFRLAATLSDKPTIFEFSERHRFADHRLEFLIETLPEGKKIIYLSPYFLEDQAKFGFIIDYKFVKGQGVAFDKHIQFLSLSLDQHFRSNKNYYADKYHLINWFIDKSSADWQHITTEDGEIIEVNNFLNESPAFSLSKKEYIFNNGNIGYSQFQGIRNYGPFKKLDEEVVFVFLFEERFKSFANELYLSLLGKSNPGTFPGFDPVFKIKMAVQNVKQVKLESFEPDALKHAIEKVEGFRETGKKIIGVYIEDYGLDKDSEASEIYYFLKYHFIKQDIPLQVVNYRKLGDRNSLKWSTSNIALAIFSKLGGIPWLVKPNNNNCLILGIGSAHKIDKETGKINKYFAYSVCLDSSGLYKRLEILADETDQENYLEKLKNNLVSLLNSDLVNNYSSCVLHLPFKIKRREIDALSAAVKEIQDLRFVAIKINTDNKFFGFSHHNTFVPYESNFIKLGADQYLVWFEGLQFGREVVDKRLANPVHIQFLNLDRDNQQDEKNFLQDVLNLSGANWRGFNAKSIPISIYYSQIIASYLESFEAMADYQDSTMSTEKPWFL